MNKYNLSQFFIYFYKNFTMLKCKSKNLSVTTAISLSKIIPKDVKKLKKSSQNWLTRHLNDPYVKLSIKKNYRARSAFKLLEINNQFNILKPGMKVVECGAAPGAWTQVIVDEINSNHLTVKDENSIKQKGIVIAIDILYFPPIEGAIQLCGCDFTIQKTTQLILDKLGDNKIDLVLSDMAPNASGSRNMDHERIVELASSAMKFSLNNSKLGSSFLCKIWDGHRTQSFKSDLEKYYKNVKIVKPDSSRNESSEIFLLARNLQNMF